jgi:two-component system, NarL family, nitrate/nitrite response regulator NarL
MQQSLKILLVDEAGILRDGLCALLQAEKGIEVAAVAGSAREATQALTQLQPQLVIMDFSAVLKTEPETITQLKRRWPELRVLVLTLRRDEGFIEAAFRAGADAYLHKNDSRSELFTTVQRLAASSGRDVPPADTAVRTEARPLEHAPGALQLQIDLTSREREVMALIARGYQTVEIAQLMSLSNKTVERYRRLLMRKLGLNSAAAVSAFAITHGYV